MIKAIAFDVDDTLLNTSEILIPFAIQKIYQVLLANGLKVTFEEFNRQRLSFVAQSSHREFFKHFIDGYPFTSEITVSRNDLAATLIQHFYEPEIPLNANLIEGSSENLNRLKSKYKIYVVTSGVEKTQVQKIEALKLIQWIPKENHLIIDGNKYKTKKQAFQMILKKENLLPAELLSVGNRLSQEIRMAKELGAKTCYFKFGEHANDIPKDHFEQADYIITHHKDFIPTCQL